MNIKVLKLFDSKFCVYLPNCKNYFFIQLVLVYFPIRLHYANCYVVYISTFHRDLNMNSILTNEFPFYMISELTNQFSYCKRFQLQMAAKINSFQYKKKKINSIIWPQVLRVYKAKIIASNCGQMTSTNLQALKEMLKMIKFIIYDNEKQSIWKNDPGII